jgi:hypothetical protein
MVARRARIEGVSEKAMSCMMLLSDEGWRSCWPPCPVANVGVAVMPGST